MKKNGIVVVLVAVFLGISLLIGQLQASPASQQLGDAPIHQRVTVDFVTKFGGLGVGDGQFAHPEGVAFNSSGYVYVTDNGSSDRVQIFTSDGTFIDKIILPALYSPTGGIAFNSTDFLYVGVLDFNTVTYKIVVYSPNLVKVAEYTFGSSFVGLDIDSNDNVYVAEQSLWRVTVWTHGFTYIRSLTRPLNQFSPRHVAINGSDYVFVTDWWTNDSVIVFNPSGVYVTKWTVGGGLEGITVDSNGYVYVADKGSSRIYVYTGDGQQIITWGSSGSGDMQFADLQDITVNASNFLFTVDWHNYRVAVFFFNVTGVEQIPPSITGVYIVPAAPILDVHSVTVGATITDAESVVDSARLTWSINNWVTNSTIPMIGAINMITATAIPTQSVGTQVRYEIFANDSNGNEARVYGSYIVQPDTFAPNVTSTTGPYRYTITVDDAVYIDATVIDHHSIATVSCKWSINNWVTNFSISMSNIGGDVWQTDSAIPAQTLGTTVQYEVFAKDSLNNPTYHYDYYTVRLSSSQFYAPDQSNNQGGRRGLFGSITSPWAHWNRSQAFKPQNSSYGRVAVWLAQMGYPTDNVVFEIYEAVPGNPYPLGSPLFTDSSVRGAHLTRHLIHSHVAVVEPVWYEINLTLDTNKEYVFILGRTGPLDDANRYMIEHTSSNTYFYGAGYESTGGWFTSTFDYRFITYMIDLTTPPTIASFSGPLSPQYDDTVRIYANVTDFNGVDVVEGIWSPDNWSTVYFMEMESLGGVSWRSKFPLPAFDYLTTIRWSIFANDTIGNDDFKLYSYVVGDYTPPNIISVETAAVPQGNVPYTINVTMEEPSGASGIDNTKTFVYYALQSESYLIVHSTSLTYGSGLSWGAAIPGQPFNETVRWFVEVFDFAGNNISTSVSEYTVTEILVLVDWQWWGLWVLTLFGALVGFYFIRGRLPKKAYWGVGLGLIAAITVLFWFLLPWWQFQGLSFQDYMIQLGAMPEGWAVLILTPAALVGAVAILYYVNPHRGLTVKDLIKFS